LSDDTGAEKNQGDEQLHALLAAMEDPFRSRLLYAIADYRREGVSVRQLAERLGESNRRVRYHVDSLAACGLIAVAKEEPRRGVLERYYRSEREPSISNEEILLVDDDQIRRISMHIFKAILADASAAASAGMFGTRPDEATVRIRGDVDPQGWKELYATHVWALGKIKVIIAEAEERLTNSEERPIPALSALLLFETPA
jgi:DNA-binding transcriptional ArsR family regulator